MTVALIIPTLNEEESIALVVGSIPRTVVHRIVVADGGSADRTADRARLAGAEVIAAGKGYGRACLLGTQAATDADIVVFMDGDGADDPGTMSQLVDPLRSGACDFVIGSRALGAREAGSISFHQIAAGWVFGWLTWMLYGVRYTDMCAYRAIRRDTLLGLRMQEMTYGWNLEMQMRVARAGLRVREIPVPYRCRIGGESKVAGSLRGSVRAGSRIISTFARVALEPLRRRVSN